jgi:DNA-directed RNA polymerase subunit RPC12/RpoP
MDIVFDCPNCEQELAVDSAGAGTEIECPACGQSITIPAESTKTASVPAPAELPMPGGHASTINLSAAAKVEKHLKVPVHNTPGEVLISKPKPPLNVKVPGQKRLITRTIRHASCVESGHDGFDEKVTAILNEIGEANIVGVHPIGYEHFDVGTQKVMTDFGLIVVYRG